VPTRGETFLSCLVGNHFPQHVVYQPANRIPDLHLILASGYLGLGLGVLALVAVRLLVRRAGLGAG
jgi:hypothetical protein